MERKNMDIIAAVEEMLNKLPKDLYVRDMLKNINKRAVNEDVGMARSNCSGSSCIGNG